MGRGLSQLSLLLSFGINGLGSHFGLVLGTWVFRWADLILGPGEWACKPYFSNLINYQCLHEMLADLFSCFLTSFHNGDIFAISVFLSSDMHSAFQGLAQIRNAKKKTAFHIEQLDYISKGIQDNSCLLK